MAVMADADRVETWKRYMTDIGNDREVFGTLTKADIRAAVDALDTFFSDNAATINNALPTAAKNNLTQAQKARLLTYVISQRYLKGT
jgi:hypothetical protein